MLTVASYSQTKGTVVVSPDASQTISQPAGTTLAVSNLNTAAYIQGNGSTDNTTAIQAAVDACSETCNIVLVNSVVAGQVLLPTTVNIRFTAIGPTRITSKTSAFYRYQAAYNPVPVANTVSFDGITFIKANSGIVIHDNLFFNSATNAGITVHACHFELSDAAAVGIALSGNSGIKITDNDFDTGSRLAGTAIETIADNVGAPTVRTPMVATVANNFFRYGIAFTQVSLHVGSDPAEGFIFTGNHFNGATVTASGTEISFVGNEFVGSAIHLRDLSESVFTSNYVDSGNRPGQTLLTLDNVVHISITNNLFNSGNQMNTTMVSFVNPRSLPSGTTNVTLKGNIYTGSSNTSTGGSAILFNDQSARNIYVGGENFRALYAALNFAATLDRSTIDRFEARDVLYYAKNIATHHGDHLRSDPLYAIYEVHLTGVVYNNTTPNLEIGSTTLSFPAMFNNPVVTVKAVTTVPSTPCSRGTFPSASNQGSSVSPSSLGISLYSTVGATLGFAACDAIVTLDDSLYVPPR
jgi:hypothetical protein